ncbi:MAG: glutathione S-transferase [Hyphomonadaceae bacterium]|nr:glutathione S-transferase [Hyphomonadaceae bacterium]
MKRFLAVCVILVLGACRPDDAPDPDAAIVIPSAAVEPAAPQIPSITIYHAEGRRSERIVWLMEELGLPYKLEFKRGDLAGSADLIRAVNPAMPVAPTVDIGGQVLVESGAIMETILNRYAPGKLQPEMGSLDYPYHLMWMHYAEGSLASRVIADYRAWQIQPPKERSRLVDSEQVVQYAEDWLGQHPWFGGAEFSAADIMMVFPLNFAMQLNIVDKEQFPKINAWKAKIEARPAYQAMLAKARPDGMVGSLTPLPAHAPSGPRPAAVAAAPAPATTPAAVSPRTPAVARTAPAPTNPVPAPVTAPAISTPEPAAPSVDPAAPPADAPVTPPQ